MRCEVIIAQDMSLRAKKMLHAMVAGADEAGVEVEVVKEYQGNHQVLMTYGLGHPLRRGWQERHKAGGGRLIGWDLGYWHRDVPQRFSMRVSLDDDHPYRWIRPEPPSRWDAARIALRNDADPAGPIILVGLGRKQRWVMGLEGQAWEQRTWSRLRKHYPGRKILWRPKKPEPLGGLVSCYGPPIEQVLRGASLVVCHHSNVAVDACIAGIPVECEDGAAFALYRNNPSPSIQEREEFLQSLAWWQWTPQEAVAAWAYLKDRIEGVQVSSSAISEVALC